LEGLFEDACSHSEESFVGLAKLAELCCNDEMTAGSELWSIEMTRVEWKQSAGTELLVVATLLLLLLLYHISGSCRFSLKIHCHAFGAFQLTFHSQILVCKFSIAP